MSNYIYELLCTLGICSTEQPEQLQDFVRDRNDIKVLKCKKSGVIFLDRTDHIDLSHYDAKPPTHQHGKHRREIITTGDDTERRYRDFANIVRGKTWLDVGAGSGALLDRLSPLTNAYAAVEPQETAAQFLGELGHPVYRRLEDVPEASYDVITLFHVLEHLSRPDEVLRQLSTRLTKNGRLVIEVPHARDFLIDFIDCPAFRAHTFWSEHLILHTRASLQALLEYSGYKVQSIKGVQRYPLANHLYWLEAGKVGGHQHWSMLRNTRLDEAWEATLAQLDHTDTLIAEAIQI